MNNYILKLGMATIFILYGSISFAGPPRSIIDAFSFCFNNRETGIEKHIDINGFYRGYTLIERGNRIDSVFTNYIFYSNGLFVTEFRDWNGKRNETELKNNLKIGIKDKSIGDRIDNISVSLKEIFNDRTIEEAQYFYNSTWGVYKICGDTIKVQYIYKPIRGELTGWKASELWFRIIDRNHIEYIDEYPLTIKGNKANTCSQNRINPQNKKKLSQIKLVCTTPTPKFDFSWILREKWFWCNENDWKEFMRNRKK